MTSESPILVTGPHRSGSTWVGRAIARAPDVFYLPEPFNPVHTQGICGLQRDHWFLYICRENEERYAADLDRMLRFSYNVRGELAHAHSIKGAKQLLGEWRDFIFARLNHKRPLLKDPIAIFSAPWLVERYRMQAVVLIRHPAAFVSSLKRVKWQFDYNNLVAQPLLMRDLLTPFKEQILRYAKSPPDLIDAAILQWNILHATIATFKRRFPNWIFRRHEDLSRQPKEGFRKIYKRLGLDFTPEVQTWVAETTSAENYSEPQHGEGHMLMRDALTNITNWKHRLTAEEIERTREGTAEISSKFYSNADW